MNGLLGGQTQGQQQANLLGGVFQNPSSIRRQERNSLLGNAIEISQLRDPFSASIAMGATQAGLGIGRALGFETQGDQTARVLQQVQQETVERGLDPTIDPEGTFNFISERFRELGNPQLALQAQQQKIDYIRQFRELAPAPAEFKTYYDPEGNAVQARFENDRLITADRRDITGQGFATSRPPAALVEVNTGENISPYQEARSKSAAESVENAAIAADEAAIIENQLIDLQNSLAEPGQQTGSVQQLITPIQAFADSVGVDTQSWVENATGLDLGETADKEEFDRITKDLVTRVFARFKGNLNDREVRIALGVIPSLGTSLEGNIRAIAAMRATAKLAQERGEALNLAETAAEANRLRSQFNRSSTEDFQDLVSQYEQEIREQVSQSRGQAEPAPATPTGTVDWSEM